LRLLFVRKSRRSPPSKATLKEVQRLLAKYVEEVKSVELSGCSKTMHVDFATCFVRWKHRELQPGSRGSNTSVWRSLKKSQS
jgi:phage host-nuclease inhibitor protein Gam